MFYNIKRNFKRRGYLGVEWDNRKYPLRQPSDAITYNLSSSERNTNFLIDGS